MTFRPHEFRADTKSLRAKRPAARFDPPDFRTPRKGPAVPAVTDREESRMVARLVVGMTILAIAPLVLFLVIYYHFPDLLQLWEVGLTEPPQD